MTKGPPQISWPAVHGGVLLLAFCVTVFLPLLLWPLYFLVPLAGYLVVVLLTPPLRRTMPRLPPGRIDRVGIVGAVALSAVASAVLLGYQAAFHPDVNSLASHLPAVVFRYPLVAGVCFSAVNAVLEELLCRWLLYDAVAAEWGGAAAVLATSVFFGLMHWNGYPSGPMGAVLAGAYGVGLGLLRWRSGGLVLSMACHVCADATIFWILVSSGALAGR